MAEAWSFLLDYVTEHVSPLLRHLSSAALSKFHVLIPISASTAAAFSCVSLAVFSAYYFAAAARPLEFVFARTKKNVRLMRGLRTLRGRFWPTWWLPNGHAQTIYNQFAEGPKIQYTRRTLRVHKSQTGRFAQCTFDGIVVLDWTAAGHLDQLAANAPIALIVPGLTSTSDSNYVRTVCQRLVKDGFRVCVYNPRGAGGPSTLISPQLYCAAYTEDLRQVIAHIREQFPEAPITAASYSLGSNILVKYLGEEADKTPLCCAVSLANPMDLVHAKRMLHSTWMGRQYTRVLGQNLARLAGGLREQLSSASVDYDGALEAKTICEFDELFVRRMFGFRSVNAYYRESSAANTILDVAVPLLCLHASDDPICAATATPEEDFLINENLFLVKTSTGGHSMDWYEGQFRPRSWSARVVSDFLTTAIQDMSPQMYIRPTNTRISAPPPPTPPTQGSDRIVPTKMDSPPVSAIKKRRASPSSNSTSKNSSVIQSPRVAEWSRTLDFLNDDTPAAVATADSDPRDELDSSASGVLDKSVDNRLDALIASFDQSYRKIDLKPTLQPTK